MTPLELVIGALATYRLALLVSKESGPAWVFAKLRKLPPPKSSAREGLSCQWCVSVYVAALVCLVYYWIGLRMHAGSWILHWLALSSGAITINQMFTKGK